MPASRKTTGHDPKTELSNSERLLLAQAVYEVGSDAWPQVSKLIVNHPLISRPKSVFNPQSCNEIYLNLMSNAGLDCAETLNTKQRAPSHLKLAQIHYQARVLELRELILAEETKFKTVLAEIDEIRAGLRDNQIKTDLGLSSPEPVSVPSHSPKELPVEPSEAQTPDNVLRTETDRTSEETVPLSPLSPPRSPPAVDDTKGSSTDQSPEPDALDAETLSALDQEQQIMTMSEDADQAQEPDKQDLKEDELSAQLVHSPSPPETLENGPMDKNLVPMYPDQESSSPVEIQAEVPELPETPVPEVEVESQQIGSPELTEDLGEKQSVEKHEDFVVQEESTPRVGSEEPLSMTAQRRAKEQERQDSFMERPEDNPLPQQELPVDSTPGEVLQETTLSEHSAESPKPSEVEPGIQTRRGKRKAEFEAEIKRDKKKVREGRVQSQTADHVAIRRFQNLIGLVHSQISQHRNGNIFHNPIKPSEAPDYHDIVKRPMDLKTIKARIKDGVISNSLEYQRDVYLMFANSMMYNRPNSDIYNMAEEMMLESEQHISTFRQTEGWNNR